MAVSGLETHLMMAIGNHVKEAYPWLKVKYCPSEIFQSDLIEAMKDKNLSYFRTRYRSVDVFLLDDVQFISKNADFTQEEIFHTFNYFYQNKKQIVISADRPPAGFAAAARPASEPLSAGPDCRC